MIAIGKIDAVKSKINAITALMVVFLTALFAVIGYIFVHWNEFDFMNGCIVFAGVVALIALFCGSMWLLRKEIKILEKM